MVCKLNVKMILSSKVVSFCYGLGFWEEVIYGKKLFIGIGE